MWPQVLPNGRGVLLTVTYSPTADYSQHHLAVADIETGALRLLLRGVFGRYVHAGYLVYVSADGTLLAVPFDQDEMEIKGSSVVLAEGVAIAPAGSVDLAVSEEGTLAYVRGGSTGGLMGCSKREPRSSSRR